MARHSIVRPVQLAGVLGCLLGASADTTLAQDKNGVSPQAVSRPTGPGSLEGLGDAFQPSLNSGSARYTYSIVLPSGVAGFTPALSLEYDSGSGQGVLGLGWKLNVGDIRRQSDKGTPQYGRADLGELTRPDRFLGLDGEELVPLAGGYFLARIQGSFIRYERARELDPSGEIVDYWIAHTKQGTRFVFGRSALARLVDAPSSSRCAKWCLERQIDTSGNVIEYSYIRPSETDRQIYLHRIRYGPGEPSGWVRAYEVELVYEDRPDPFTDNRVGFAVRTSKRLSRIEVRFGPVGQGELIRRYVLNYESAASQSLLHRVTQYSADEACFPTSPGGPEEGCTLPSTTFSYRLPQAAGGAVVSAASHVILSINSFAAPAGCDVPVPLANAPDDPNSEFVDLNADGLPDLLYTPLEGQHVGYLNRGVLDFEGVAAIYWEPVCLSAGAGDPPCDPTALDHLLSNSKTHLADMTGDGVADLVFTEGRTSVVYYENTGKLAWGCATPMAVGNDPPPAPFDNVSGDVISVDLDFDKRMDVLQCNDAGYTAWFNLGGGAFSDGNSDLGGALYDSSYINCRDPIWRVQSADMNGDRMSDMVIIQDSRVAFAPSLGNGEYLPVSATTTMTIPGVFLEAEARRRAQLVDLNGDGLSDLAIDRFAGEELYIWLNLGEQCQGADCRYTFSTALRVTGLPISPDAVTRWVDINGNGTTDLVYADSRLAADHRIQAIDIGVLLNGTAAVNVLTGISNGYGREIAIEHKSSTSYLVEAFWAARETPPAGRVWSRTLPFPTTVVSRVETTFGLNLDGFDVPDPMATVPVPPGQDVYITDYTYRDGYYDPLEKQFRGFGFVKEIQHGDERFGETTAPTLVTRYGFHTGAPDGLDNDGDGQIDEFTEWGGREEEPLKGVELWRETTVLPDVAAEDGAFAPDAKVFERLVATWVVRDLSTSTGGALADLLGVIRSVGTGYRTNDAYGRAVRQAVRTRVDSHVIERGSGTAKTLRTESDIDPLGNQRFEWKYGDLCNARDDLYTGSEYVLDSNAESGWIIDRVQRQYQKDGGPTGTFVSETRNYYDGPAFVGLPHGQMGPKGDLHRTESFVSVDPVPPLTERSYVLGDPRDPSGRVDTLRQQLDTYGNPTVLRDANGHDHIIAYDDLLHAFPTRETIVLGDGKPDLVVNATYDYRFGKPATVTDFNGNVSEFRYDTFGRLNREIFPGDDPNTPTHTYSYQLGAPISSITTTAHTREGGSPDVVTRLFFDGLGRKLGLWEAGGPVMKEVTLYSQRGQAWKVFSPFAGGDGTWSAPAGTLPAVTSTYDASGRVLVTLSLPDNNGEVARAIREYLPLRTVERDGEDNRLGSPHYNTPKTLVNDGLGRLIEVHEIETLSAADSGTFVTTYRYAIPDLLAEIEDANGNIKYMRYDGLGRRIFMNDLDRGHMTYTFDAAGNLVGTVDAKGQQIAYTYDGGNRLLTEDHLDDASPLSLHRTPDVAYHYDKPNTDRPELRNVKGKLAWVEDLTGAEFLGYDSRSNPETVVKRISQIEGGTKDYTTVSYADSVGRVYQIIYPDGGVVRYDYDARGLLRSIPGFLTEASYYPSGQKDTWHLGNGVVTSHTYDPRLRLSRLFTQGTAEVLQDLDYIYDQADNITAIGDTRPLPLGDPRSQTASYLMDNSYRLARADGVGWSQEFDYDRLGNMTKKLSTDPAHPEEHIGTMLSGGSAGTIGRIGRDPGDPPGPHALTWANNGIRQRVFDYDANGNMTNNDGDSYLYDFSDRLGKVIKDSHDIRYLYDYTGRRVIKRVDGVQTTYISKLSEIRDGQMLNYVFVGDTRLARVDGMIDPPAVVTQRIPLLEGWNLISFQVYPGTTVPAILLAELGGRYTDVFGHDGTAYSRYVPDAGDNTLAAMLPNHGYWIHVTRNAEWLLNGSISETSVEIPANTPMLLGFPVLASRNVTEILSEYAQVTSIRTYASEGGSWLCFDSAAPLFISRLKSINVSKGFWLVCKQATTLSPATDDPPLIVYYHADHLGSTNLVTDSTSGLSTETAYFPFGTPRNDYQSGLPRTDPFYRFTGKEQDSESELWYYGMRYTSSSFARFASADPIATRIQNDARILSRPQRIHPYSYVLNNPLRYSDPDGLSQYDVAVSDDTAHGAGQADIPDPQERITLSGKAIPSSAKEVLEGIMRAAGVTGATVTSTTRTASEQAKAMYDNLTGTGKGQGVEAQKTLYGSAGDKVIEVYENNKDKAKDEVVKLMTEEINAQGPTNVSKHCDPGRIVFDVGPSSIPQSERAAFAREARKAMDAGKLESFIPYPKDPGFHFVLKK